MHIANLPAPAHPAPSLRAQRSNPSPRRRWERWIIAPLLAFNLQPARAQNSPSSPSVSVPAVDCKQYTLTGPVFMNVLNTIIKHGDLTDIAFLQKTLGTKFSVSYGLIDGNPDHQEPEYDSNQVLGSPIHVHVSVNLDEIEGKPSLSGNWIAGIRFEGTSMVDWGYINDCMELPVQELESRYGAEGFHQISASPPGNGPLGERARAEFPGKDNTKLSITWLYGPSATIAIVQEK